MVVATCQQRLVEPNTKTSNKTILNKVCENMAESIKEKDDQDDSNDQKLYHHFKNNNDYLRKRRFNLDGSIPILKSVDLNEDLAKYEACFQNILKRINTCKNLITAFAIFHLAFVIASDFMVKPSSINNNQSKQSVSLFIDYCQVHILIAGLQFACRCIGLVIGLTFGCRYQAKRHPLHFDYSSLMFVLSLTFLVLAILDLWALLQSYPNLIALILLLLCNLFKNILAGFKFVLLFYAFFDLKMDPLKHHQARRYVQLYILMFLSGLCLALILNTYYFSGVYQFDSYRIIQSVMKTLIWCRIALSITSSVWFCLIWFGAASIHELNVVKPNADFEQLEHHYPNAYYLNTSYIMDHRLTLNFVSLACQIEPDSSNGSTIIHPPFNEDDLSIRTVSGWRRFCFSIIGSIQFSLIFHLILSHLVGTSQWPLEYYHKDSVPITDNGRKVMAGYLILVGAFSMTRFLLYWNPKLCRNKIKSPKILLMASLIIYMTANIYHLLPNIYHGWNGIFLTNLIFGFTLGLMLDKVCRFLSTFISIQCYMVETTIKLTIAHSSLIFLIQFYLFKNQSFLKKFPLHPVYLLHLLYSFIALLITLNLSYCKCLNSRQDFDLMEMRSLSSSENSNNHHLHPDDHHSHEIDDFDHHIRVDVRNSIECKRSTVPVTLLQMKHRLESAVSLFNLPFNHPK